MPDKNSNIIPVDPVSPDQQIIRIAGKMLQNDSLIIFPAATMYGIAVNALSDTAVEKVFNIKQRPKNMPILVLIRSDEQVEKLVKAVPEAAKKIMARFWPGKVTLVFEARQDISAILTAGTGKIGIRLPGNPVARALVEAVDFPVTGTSANLSGHPSASAVSDLAPGIMAKSAMILDAGPLKGGDGSTIVDVTTDPVTIIREGRISIRQIFDAV